MSSSLLSVRVQTMRFEAQGIVSVELMSPEGAELPAFEAGSHIDLHLANGIVRSYSLLNAPSERHRYVVGVLNDRNSRGGSRYVHEQLRVGATLTISAPRNNFPVDESAAHSVLVAGGIGITPISCMLNYLRDKGKSAELLYCARSRAEAAFANVHIERFAAAENVEAVQGDEYVAELARSKKSVTVPAGKSLLDALLDAGLDVDHSCREGVCGACETKVLEGEPEHRDGVLSKAEKASNKMMMVCVSGCKGRRLVLDL